MSEEVEVVITLSSEWHMKPPKIKVYVDDQLFEECYLEEKDIENKNREFKWVGNVEEGTHKIRIDMLEKVPQFTKIDDKGNILQDQLLYIKEVSIDQIDLGHLVYKNCKFYPDKKFHPDLNDILPNLNCVGYNGTWELEFSVPTYIWLLENL
jgi:hypothetical protein